MMHEGHLKKSAEEIQVFLLHHDEESTCLATNAMNIHLGCGSSTQPLVNEHTDAFFTPSQLVEQLKRSRSLNGAVPNVPVPNLNHTAAERLLFFLQSQKDLS
jgi:hypothetical protein